MFSANNLKTQIFLGFGINVLNCFIYTVSKLIKAGLFVLNPKLSRKFITDNGSIKKLPLALKQPSLYENGNGRHLKFCGNKVYLAADF